MVSQISHSSLLLFHVAPNNNGLHSCRGEEQVALTGAELFLPVPELHMVWQGLAEKTVVRKGASAAHRCDWCCCFQSVAVNINLSLHSPGCCQMNMKGHILAVVLFMQRILRS